jgi:hypothetical protein
VSALPGRPGDRYHCRVNGTVHTGLCGRCVHRRLVQSRRGSTFLLCGLSRTDPRYPRYPRLPVLLCDGFRDRSADDEHEEENDDG